MLGFVLFGISTLVWFKTFDDYFAHFDNVGNVEHVDYIFKRIESGHLSILFSSVLSLDIQTIIKTM